MATPVAQLEADDLHVADELAARSWNWPSGVAHPAGRGHRGAASAAQFDAERDQVRSRSARVRDRRRESRPPG